MRVCKKVSSEQLSLLNTVLKPGTSPTLLYHSKKAATVVISDIINHHYNTSWPLNLNKRPKNTRNFKI